MTVNTHTVLVSPFVRRVRCVALAVVISVLVVTVVYLSPAMENIPSSTSNKPRHMRSLHQASPDGAVVARSKSLSESNADQFMEDLHEVETMAMSQKNKPRGRHLSDETPRKFQTFFSNMTTRFCDVIPVDGDKVPTLPFLDACRNVLPIFDRINPTAFTPVKLDIASNIKRINETYRSDREKFHTLQDIVLADIAANQHQDSHSATLSILWLKRTVDFVVEFLKELRISKEDLTEGVVAAYSRTLRPHHGWVLRGMFAVALRAVPDKSEMVKHLAVHPDDVKQPNFEQQLMYDMDQCLTAQEQLCDLLTNFLVQHKLDTPDDQV